MVIFYMLDNRRISPKGVYAVRIRVFVNNKASFFGTGHFLTQVYYDQMVSDRATSEQQRVRNEILAAQARITNIIAQLPVYSAEAVRKRLELIVPVQNTPRNNNVLDWIEYKAVECITVKASHGNAENYWSTAAFYKKQLGMTEIPFEYITTARLFELQRKCQAKYSLSTIGKYARHLRCIFNMAIAEGFIPKSQYPFGMHKYVPPTSRKRKHALSREALQALLGYKPVTEREQLHLDLFAFSFFGNGLNMKDVATLRYRHMDKDRIVKLREKTINSAQEPITIKLTSQLRAIITRHGNTDTSPDNYIFPLLQKEWNEEQIFLQLKSLRGKIGRTLTAIGKTLSIAGNLPHGTSRHCFANAMKQSGASDEYISETIGHSSVAVTKHYTSNFEEDGFTTQDFLTKYTKK